MTPEYQALLDATATAQATWEAALAADGMPADTKFAVGAENPLWQTHNAAVEAVYAARTALAHTAARALAQARAQREAAR